METIGTVFSLQALKDQRAEYLWKQLERVIPDIRQRTKVTRVKSGSFFSFQCQQ